MQFISLLNAVHVKLKIVINLLRIYTAMEHYITLVASKHDTASITMANYLMNNRGFFYTEENASCLQSKMYRNIRLYISNRSSLHLEDLDDIYPDSTAFVFLSKHVSQSNIPALTCHSTGNYTNDISYGGNPRELAISYPYLQKHYLIEITRAKPTIQDYDIIIEATHHGPTSLKKPVMFVEIGSNERQWIDSNAASVTCNCLLNAIGHSGRCKKVGICLGGTHYPTKFNKLLLESDFGLAAIAAKHNLESVDKYMLDQMISKSIEKVTHIIVDWKGLGKEKDRIMGLIQDTGFELVKV
jgi:D-aminoacyl-tRNA deacylase